MVAECHLRLFDNSQQGPTLCLEGVLRVADGERSRLQTSTHSVYVIFSFEGKVGACIK